METRVKITYLDMYGSNKVLAKITNIWGWQDLPNKFSQLGITENRVIRVERVLTATDNDTDIL